MGTRSGWGSHNMEKFHNNPLHPVAMARKKRKMYKSLALVKTENVGHTGGQYVIAKVQKQQNQITSAWLEKLRIAFHIDASDDMASANRPPFFGGQFYLATSDSSINTDTVLTSTGFDGFGGTCTLRADRAIRDNAEDNTEADGILYLWIATTDLNLQSGDLTGSFAIEAHGRWHEVVSA